MKFSELFFQAPNQVFYNTSNNPSEHPRDELGEGFTHAFFLKFREACNARKLAVAVTPNISSKYASEAGVWSIENNNVIFKPDNPEVGASEEVVLSLFLANDQSTVVLMEEVIVAEQIYPSGLTQETKDRVLADFTLGHIKDAFITSSSTLKSKFITPAFVNNFDAQVSNLIADATADLGEPVKDHVKVLNGYCSTGANFKVYTNLGSIPLLVNDPKLVNLGEVFIQRVLTYVHIYREGSMYDYSSHRVFG
jgi:hypothetical protein